MTLFKSLMLGSAALILGACGNGGEAAAPDQPSAAGVTLEHGAEELPPRAFTADKFTQSNYRDVRVTHLALDLDVDFDAKVLRGTATLDFKRVNPDATELVLDTKGLDITGVHLSSEEWKSVPAEYTLGAFDPALGGALRINILDPVRNEYGAPVTKVTVYYGTSPDAEGLQWLSPEQTAGKTQPYLFSQAQALNARTMAPVQDTPAVRMTYSAKLRVPEGILPLMSCLLYTSPSPRDRG